MIRKYCCKVIPLFILGACTPILLSADTSSAQTAPATYEENMKTVSGQIARNDFQGALTLLNDMERRYPGNADILSRRAALYYWTHSYDSAISDYDTLYTLTKDPVYLDEIEKVSKARQEALSREKKNFAAVQKERYSYQDKQPDEKDTTLQLGMTTGGLTWIVSGASIERYNLTDKQAGIELYSNLGAKEERRWGYVSYYKTPSPHFLASWDASAGIYQGILEDVEISLVYRHMSFANDEVDIIKPGISFPLPWVPLRFSEEFHWVPDTRSYSSVGTLSYDPSYRFHGYYTFTIGNSAEEFRDETDIRRVRTLSHAVGGTWRFDPSWAVAAEITDGFRSQMYRRSGGKILLKYFW